MGKTEKYHILDREMGKAKNEEWGMGKTKNKEWGAGGWRWQIQMIKT